MLGPLGSIAFHHVSASLLSVSAAERQPKRVGQNKFIYFLPHV